jgi:hypothetical protein
MEEPFGPPEKLQISMLRAEHQKRYQMTIDFVKERLGEATEHSNEIARLQVSPRGACCELLDLPEEFCAALGPGVSVTYLEERAIAPILTACADLLRSEKIQSVRSLRITMYYSRRGLIDNRSCFCVDLPDPRSPSGAPRIIGAYRPGEVPLFFRVRCDCEESPVPDVTKAGQFMIFGLVTRSRLNPVVIVSYADGAFTDLSSAQRSSIPD